MPLRGCFVTGTDTGVGKTVATAALACKLTAEGTRVVVVKPAQTGVEGDEPGDAQEVTRLSGVPAVEGVRLRQRHRVLHRRLNQRPLQLRRHRPLLLPRRSRQPRPLRPSAQRLRSLRRGAWSCRRPGRVPCTKLRHP